jgi:hypothetical protein
LNGFAYTRIRDVCSENLRRYAVKKVEFSQDGATLVSSNDNETISWDVATGARKDKVAGQLAVAKTAFFRAPSPITIVSCAGDKIAVCCQNFAVLTLHAAWLTD